MIENRQKKISGIIMILLVLMMLIGGSLAWQDLSQHKTNTFKTTSIQQNVVLVEDFTPKDNWKRGERVKKEVSVRNGQESDNVDEFIYDDAYIRLQFKEYMGVGKETFIPSENRLMIDKDGNFVRKENKADAVKYLEDNKMDENDRVVELQGLYDEKKYFYIETQAKDTNGQYGKFLTMGVIPGEEKSITGGAVYQEDFTNEYHQKNKDKPEFTTHLWDNSTDSKSKESAFTKYVSWELGEVITIEEWVAAGKKPVAKWILDTDSTEGWAYWGQPLVHHAGTAQPDSISKLILQSVTLDNMPDGVANYLLHVNMDAVSKSDLNLWTDAPQIIKDLHGAEEGSTEAPTTPEVSRDALKSSIDKANSFNAIAGRPAADALLTGITTAQTVYDREDATQEEVDAAKVKLDNLIEAYEIDLVRAALEAKLVEANSKQESKYTSESFAQLKKAKTEGQAVLNNNNAATKAQLQTAINNLNTAIAGLVLKPNAPSFVGQKLTFANHGWTVIAKDGGKSLVLADTLTKQQMNKMGVMSNVNGYGRYQYTAGNKVPYSQSYLKIIDQEFYNTFIKPNANLVSAVEKVQIQDEVGIVGWQTRKDKPTLKTSTGIKTAFSLSISDLNYYQIATGTNLANSEQYWMRSPAAELNHAASMSRRGVINWDSNTTNNDFMIRPALWIDLTYVDLGN